MRGFQLIVVAMCCSPLAARAAIVTGSLNTAVSLNYTGYNPPSPEIRRFDINGDGLADLEFNYYVDPNLSEYTFALVRAAGVATSGQFAGPASDHPLAREFGAGQTVGPGTEFSSFASLMVTYRSGPDPTNSYSGVWEGGATHTAGFAFTDAGTNVRYGWFRAFLDFENLTLFTQAPSAVILLDFAYESEPRTGILVPSPTAAGTIIFAIGVAASRRRRSVG